jgi:hypothetical protein
MNSELNTKLEELTQTLEKIGFKDFSIDIYQHFCTETQAKQLMETVDSRIVRQFFEDDDGETTDWLETTLRPYPNEIKIHCTYTPDKEAPNDPNNRT